MNRIIKSCVSSIIILGLAGCSNVSNQDVGTVGGAVLGGLIGSQLGGGMGSVAAMGGGMVLGAMLGGKIGQSMDEVDRMKMRRALERTPTNQTTRWVNPDNGRHYAVTPKRTYQREGQPCREYTTTAIIGGKKQEIYGTACRTAEGSWRVIH